MTTLETEIHIVRALNVSVTDDSIIIDLEDGRSVTAPLAWYPRLHHGTAKERSHWKLIGHGEGIHWPDLDEDISVENILCGKPSQESQNSLKKWISQRMNT